jgi:DNA-binding HxlR family transcriptional regulator
MARAAERIGDRWTLLILREAFYGVQRYDDMRQDLDIPRSVLTDRLKKMVADGLLERFEYQEPGDRKRFGYALTPAGRALAPVMVALTEWGERFVTKKPTPVGVRHKASGDWLHLGLLDAHDRPVEWRDAAMAKCQRPRRQGLP